VPARGNAVPQNVHRECKCVCHVTVQPRMNRRNAKPFWLMLFKLLVYARNVLPDVRDGSAPLMRRTKSDALSRMPTFNPQVRMSFVISEIRDIAQLQVHIQVASRLFVHVRPVPRTRRTPNGVQPNIAITLPQGVVMRIETSKTQPRHHNRTALFYNMITSACWSLI